MDVDPGLEAHLPSERLVEAAAMAVSQAATALTPEYQGQRCCLSPEPRAPPRRRVSQGRQAAKLGSSGRAPILRALIANAYQRDVTLVGALRLTKLTLRSKDGACLQEHISIGAKVSLRLPYRLSSPSSHRCLRTSAPKDRAIKRHVLTFTLRTSLRSACLAPRRPERLWAGYEHGFCR